MQWLGLCSTPPKLRLQHKHLDVSIVSILVTFSFAPLQCVSTMAQANLCFLPNEQGQVTFVEGTVTLNLEPGASQPKNCLFKSKITEAKCHNNYKSSKFK